MGHPRPQSVYRQRNPQNTSYYQCVEQHFEQFEQDYDDRLAKQYGFMQGESFIDILIAVSCIMALLGLDVKTAATNICWPFSVKEDTFAHHVTKKELWNLGKGFVKRY